MKFEDQLKMKQFIIFSFITLIISSSHLSSQDCGRSVVKEPSKITFERDYYSTKFVGQIDFAYDKPASERKFYRRINYDGGWQGEQAVFDCCKIDDNDVPGRPQVSIGGAKVYSNVDGSILQYGVAELIGTEFSESLGSHFFTNTMAIFYYYYWASPGGIMICPFAESSVTPTSRTYTGPASVNSCGRIPIGNPTSHCYTASSISGGASITLSEPDTIEDAIANYEGRNGFRIQDDNGGASAYLTTSYINPFSIRIHSNIVNIKALFEGCPGSRWEVQMVVAKGPTGTNAGVTSRETVRRSIRMDNNGEYLFTHQLFVKEPNTAEWVESLVAIEQPSCEGFGDYGNLGSIRWSANLGGNSSGESAGALRIDAEDVSSLSYTPSDLALSHRGIGTETVLDENGLIRQVVTPTIIADVVTETATSYHIRLYCRDSAWATDPATGIYSVSGTPFITHTVSQQVIDQSERLRITTTNEGQTDYREFGYSEDSSTETWSMWEGSGAKRTSVSENLDYYPNNEHPFVTYLGSDVASRTTSVYNSSDELISRVERVYELQTLNPIDPDYRELDIELLRIEHFYRTNETEPDYEIFYTYEEDSDDPNYNRLILREDSRGPWTKWTYHEDGRVHTEESGYLNSAANGSAIDHQLHTHTYSTVADLDGDGEDEVLKTSTLKILDNIVEVSYEMELSALITSEGNTLREVRYIQGHTPSAAWDAVDNIVSKSWVHVSSDPFLDGAEYARLNPDNTVVINKRTLNADGTATKKIFSGLVIMQNGVPTGVSAGTITTEEINAGGGTTSEETEDVESNLIIASTLYTDFDDEGRASTLTFLDGTQESRFYTCCGLEQMTDAYGMTTHYDYDSLDRIEYTTTALDTDKQQVVRHVMDAEGNITAVYRGPDASNLNLVTEMDYGLDGALLRTRDRYLDAAPSTDRETTISYSEDANGRQMTTTTYPNGLTRVETYYDDGRLFQVTGSAVRGSRYFYGIEQDNELGYAARTNMTVLLDEAGNQTDSIEKTYTDAFGRIYKLETPAADGGTAVTRYDYNDVNQRIREVDPDGVSTLYAYGNQGEPEVTALDANGNNTIDYNGTDRITRTKSFYTTRTEGSDDYIVQRQTVEVWETNALNSATVISTVDQSLGDLPGANVGSVSWSTVYGQTTRTEMLIEPSLSRTTTTTVSPDDSYQVDIAVNGFLENSTQYDRDSGILSNQTYYYENDDENRLYSITDLYSGTTSYAYYEDGQLKRVTTPDPDTTKSGIGYDSQITSYVYTDDASSISRTTTLPDLTAFTEVYYPTGELKEVSGSQQYPVFYDYDYAGRLKSQTTWQNRNDNADKATTAWEYYANGQLKKKWYNASIAGDGTISGTAGPSYTYTPGGRLKTRTNARGTVVTYTYEPSTLDLTSITFNDEITPAVNYPVYDRQGRIETIVDASGSRNLVYENGQLLDENYTEGILQGYSINRETDVLNRLDFLTLSQSALEHYRVDYGYDGASRLKTVAHGEHTVTYAYDPQTELREIRTFNNGTIDVLRVEHRYDSLNRLKSVSALNTASAVLGNYSYTYNALNQRTRMTVADNSYWEYGYDSLGQVTNAIYKDASNAAYPGRSFGFVFDDIGNRTATNTNGRVATYTPNDLNQYEQRQVPRMIDVSGHADPEATVTVNNNVTTRLGAYFYHGLDLSSEGNGAQQIDISATASFPDGGDNDAARFADSEKIEYLAPDPEDFVYDDDGNLKQDGKWLYTWNADNRLVAVETREVAYNVGAPRQKLEFAYDSQGRRFSKKVYDWDATSNSYLLTSSFLYLYDGWNLIAELKSFHSSLLTLHHSYIWGTDLSGNLQGVGGVGGLLAVIDETGSTSYPAFDGNGNVMGYYAADSGESVAEFEYGAFGELIRATGEKKDAFNFRFSTKYEDAETGLLYYGYRYYNAETGRWLTRDPIGENGGLNLYGFVDNDGINYVDDLGQKKHPGGYTGPVPKDQQSPTTYPKPTTPAPTTPSNLVNGSGRANKTGGAAVDAISSIASGFSKLSLEGMKRLARKNCAEQKDPSNDGCYCCHYWVYSVTFHGFFLASETTYVGVGGRVYEGNCYDVSEYVENTYFFEPSFVKNPKRQSQKRLDFYESW